jgi:hypothetical protein
MTLIDFNDPICPSCGRQKQDSTGKDMSNAVVCFYCYTRGSLSNLKMFILYVLNELDRPVTIYELAKIMNNHPALKGRCMFTRNRIKNALNYMTRPNNKLILKGKKKNNSKNGAGRKVNTYRIGKRKGVKYLARYLDRWDRGGIVHLNRKRTKGLRRVVQRNENFLKHLHIKNKIADGQYDRFDFLFIRDLVKSLDKN